MWDMNHITWELSRLVLAAVVGAAIGFEREAHGQAAGLRTFILVTVGACLMMMLSLEMEELHRHLAVDQSVVRLDPARIASYAIASMGFLGAGAIITGKGSVRGLTTAAGLCVAVPCYVAFNYLLSRIQAIVLDINKATSEIIYFFTEVRAREKRAAAPPEESPRELLKEAVKEAIKEMTGKKPGQKEE